MNAKNLVKENGNLSVVDQSFHRTNKQKFYDFVYNIYNSNRLQYRMYFSYELQPDSSKVVNIYVFLYFIP